MAIRIKGLVRAFNDVRSQLQAGIDPNQERQFRDHVRAIVEKVEEICATHNTCPNALPSPSYRAYNFLKVLGSRDLPRTRNPRSDTVIPRLKVANIVKGAEVFSKSMWDELSLFLKSDGTRDGLASDISKFVSGIEAVCSRHDTTPASLEIPSRRAYGWLKFLLEDNHLHLHLAALDRGRSAMVTANTGARTCEMHMANMNSIWRRRNRGKLVFLKVNEGFLYANDKVWQALMDSLLLGRSLGFRILPPK